MTEVRSTQDKILMAWQWIDFTTYGFTLAFAVHNTVRYLIMQGRWNNIYHT